MSEIRPLFDLLWILNSLTHERQLGASEPHLFGYLACVMSIYDGRDPSWWGYSFTTTRAGAPFAEDLAEALPLAVGAGLVVQEGSVISLTTAGESDAGSLRRLPSMASRLVYLRAATNAALALPLPTITEAVSSEPQLAQAVRLGQARALFDENGLALLRPHLDGLRDLHGASAASDPVADLSVRGILWLSYLVGRGKAPSVVGV